MDEQNASQQPTEAEEQQGERTFTQEEVNRLIGKEKARYKGFDEYRKKAKELDELKAAQMSELDKANAELERLRAENERFKRDEDKRAWVATVAEKTGVPKDVLSAMSAESEEDLASKAESLKGYFEKPVTPVVKTDGAQPSAPAPDEGADSWLRSTLPDSMSKN